MAKTLQHQIIEGALHLIAEEEHWTRCSMARNREEIPAPSGTPPPCVSARWARCGALRMN